ncbi:MAG: YqhA family protein [Candidatus Competibacteraceae bacterium]
MGDLFAKTPINDKAFLTDVLTLIDFFLIAGLLTMVMIAGYENFVARTDLGKRPNMPSWIGRLTHHDLKLNLSLTIMAISMFNLLQLFLEMAEANSTLTDEIIKEIPWLIGIHITFIISALAFALINRLGHSMPLESQGKDNS